MAMIRMRNLAQTLNYLRHEGSTTVKIARASHTVFFFVSAIIAKVDDEARKKGVFPGGGQNY